MWKFNSLQKGKVALKWRKASGTCRIILNNSVGPLSALKWSRIENAINFCKKFKYPCNFGVNLLSPCMQNQYFPINIYIYICT